MYNKIIIGFVVVGTISAVTSYLFIKSQKKQKLGDINMENKEKDLLERQDKIKSDLGIIEEELRKNALGYYVESYFRDYKLTDKQIEELRQNYPKVFARPSIDWTKNDYFGDDFDILEKMLSDYTKLDTADGSYKLKVAFEKKLLEESENRAIEILNDKVNSNENSLGNHG